MEVRPRPRGLEVGKRKRVLVESWGGKIFRPIKSALVWPPTVNEKTSGLGFVLFASAVVEGFSRGPIPSRGLYVNKGLR